MSHADASRPLPVFMKLAIMLGNIPAVQFLFAKLAALLRSDTRSAESLLSKFLGEGPGFTGNAGRQAAVLELPVRYAVAAPQSNDQYEREKLIRRRWTETGIKMWNPLVHGAGLAALNIQGRTELLPVKPGETLPGYDKLQFALVGGCIVCEDVVVASAEALARNDRNRCK